MSSGFVPPPRADTSCLPQTNDNPATPNHALQRTATAVTPAASSLRLSSATQRSRQPRGSLSLRSLAVARTMTYTSNSKYLIAAFLIATANLVFAQNGPIATVTGNALAVTADTNTSSSITYYATIPDTVTAADIFGVAHAEGTSTLFQLSDSFDFDFSSEVYVSSANNTAPSAEAVLALSFTATAPVHVTLSSDTYASSLSNGHSTSYVALNDAQSGALITDNGANLNLRGINYYGGQSVQFDGWLPAGSYYFQASAEAYLNPNPSIPQTYGESRYQGTLSVSQVPEPSSALFAAIGIVVLFHRRTRK